jgi:anti-sigma-K factor RskA
MSMHTDTPDIPASQIEAYALGALDADERAAVEQLLAESPEHQAELRQLREVVAMLPYAVAPADPPEHVRAQLFARIAAERAAAEPARRPAAPPRARAWLLPAAFAILAALVLALGGLTISLGQTVAGLDRANRQLVDTLVLVQQTLAQTQNRQDELAAQLTAGRVQIDQLNTRLAQEQYVVSFVSAPGVATRTLNAVAASQVARGEMYMYPGKADAVVLFSGLPALRPGTVYQFWLADASSQVAGGTFAVDDHGIATLVVEAPREVNAFTQVMLTVEPSGGSAHPSDQVVLQGTL